MKSFEKIRDERVNFPAAEKNAYFETGSTGLIPKYVFEAINQYQLDRYCLGGDSKWGSKGYNSIDMMEKAKQKIAAMMHCKAEDISFAMNASHAISFFTSNIEIKKGSNVVIPENAFNSGKFMWQIREREGLEIRYAKVENGRVSPENIINLIDENTIAVHCTYIESSTGFRIDAKTIGEYCREHGVCFILDATQALGVIQVDVEKICADVVVGNDYKWMMNYGGIGYAYIRKDIRLNIHPKCAGWMSDQNRFYSDEECLNLRKDGGRFELGFPDMAGIYGVGLVAEKYTQLDGQLIEEYVLSICDYLKKKVKFTQGLSLQYDFEDKNRSQIIYILVDGKFNISKDYLAQKGIMCDVKGKTENGETILRIGIHYYNNENDVDKLIETIIN